MLFLVISEPRPEPPTGIAEARQRFWTWVDPLIAAGRVRSIHAKVGRGAVALFDVESNDELHTLLSALPLFPYMKLHVTPLAKHPSSIR